MNSNMANIFSEIEEKIFFDESIIFDKLKIQNFILNYLAENINSKKERERGFYFQEIVYAFFEYMHIPLIKSKKTRDFGIDGIIKMEAGIFGKINLGLQIKYKLIDSNDVDLFLSALRNSELQLGVIVCKDSRRLEKYELNSKLKAILLSKGIKVKERLINEDLSINPIIILKFEDIIKISSLEMRAVVAGIYKK